MKKAQEAYHDSFATVPEVPPPPYESTEPIPEGSSTSSDRSPRRPWGFRLLASFFRREDSPTNKRAGPAAKGHSANTSESFSTDVKTVDKRSISSPLPKPAKSGETYVKPCKPIIFRLGPKDPTKVRCHCGLLRDTTTAEPGMPTGHVRCTCGYTVTSSGASFFDISSAPPKEAPASSSAPSTYCDCGKALVQSNSCAQCGLWLTDKGWMLRKSGPNWVSLNKFVDCDCGSPVNLGLVYVISHNRRCMGSPALTHYEYTLPERHGRCTCGRTLRADGTTVMESHDKCCTVSKVTRRGLPESSKAK